MRSAHGQPRAIDQPAGKLPTSSRTPAPWGDRTICTASGLGRGCSHSEVAGVAGTALLGELEPLPFLASLLPGPATVTPGRVAIQSAEEGDLPVRDAFAFESVVDAC